MSEFPEIFPLEDAKAIAATENSAEVLRLWLSRAVQEVEHQYEHNQCVAELAHDYYWKMKGMEAAERLRTWGKRNDPR